MHYFGSWIDNVIQWLPVTDKGPYMDDNLNFIQILLIRHWLNQ